MICTIYWMHKTKQKLSIPPYKATKAFQPKRSYETQKQIRSFPTTNYGALSKSILLYKQVRLIIGALKWENTSPLEVIILIFLTYDDDSNRTSVTEVVIE